MDDEAAGKLEIGYAPGKVVIDVHANRGHAGIMTTIENEDDALTLIAMLQECTTRAFRKTN